MSKAKQPRKTRAKRDPEEQLIEIAHQMLQVCAKRCGVNNYWSKQYGPAMFCLQLEGLHDQVNALSSERLGFVVGNALGPNTKTFWRRTPLEETDSFVNFFPRASLDPGRDILVNLARLVIAAAIYDILAIERLLRLGEMHEDAFSHNKPPQKLLKFVRRVRLRQKP